MAYETGLRLPVQAAPIDRAQTPAALSTGAGVEASQIPWGAIIPPAIDLLRDLFR